MKVYRFEQSITVHVQPGKEFPETSDFVDVEKNPILFSVKFEEHMAKVDSPLGRYMIDSGLAFVSLQLARDAQNLIAHA